MIFDYLIYEHDFFFNKSFCVFVFKKSSNHHHHHHHHANTTEDFIQYLDSINENIHEKMKTMMEAAAATTTSSSSGMDNQDCERFGNILSNWAKNLSKDPLLFTTTNNNCSSSKGGSIGSSSNNNNSNNSNNSSNNNKHHHHDGDCHSVLMKQEIDSDMNDVHGDGLLYNENDDIESTAV